jgi:ubiquilin
MDEERIQRMMSDPNVQQSMNEALNNPDFVNMLIDSNPMLRNIPNARDIITSPFMRQMMSNPQMMSQAMRMQRSMRGGEAAFPAPGATDTTPSAGHGSTDQTNNNQQPNPLANPFMMPGAMGAGGGFGNPTQMAQMLQSLYGQGSSPFAQPPSTTPSTTANAEGTTQGSEPRDGQAATPSTQGAGASPDTQGQTAANPFAALFPQGGNAANPFGMNPEMMQQMMQMLTGPGAGTGAGAGGPVSPPDNRPPEERYAEQLRQLNDMGFYDFERNVAALRRSGGSVQGAIEHLLGATD